MTPEVGANDGLVAVRVVPAGRDGTKVYGRTLKPGEVDPGVPVTYYPNAGEELHFRPGSVEITIEDVDRMAKPGPDGYATISNTVWTWLIATSAPTDPALFRFLLAASRRLDTAHSLYTYVDAALGSFSGSYPHQREQVFAALGLSELLCVGLGAVDMLQQIPTQFSVNLQVPATITVSPPKLLRFHSSTLRTAH